MSCHKIFGRVTIETSEDEIEENSIKDIHPQMYVDASRYYLDKKE